MGVSLNYGSADSQLKEYPSAHNAALATLLLWPHPVAVSLARAVLQCLISSCSWRAGSGSDRPRSRTTS